MYVKIHKTGKNIIVAICDENLLGKKFEEKNCQLEISEEFYKGEIMPEKEIIKIIKTAPIVNLVGKKSVDLGIKSGIVSKEDIKKVKGVPHVQIFEL